jgi:hypothetical protein
MHHEPRLNHARSVRTTLYNNSIWWREPSWVRSSPVHIIMRKNVLALLLLFSGGDGGLSNAFSVRRSSLVGARSSFTKRQTGPSTTYGYSTITSNHRPLAAMPLEVIDPSYNLALGSLALGSIFVLPGSPLKSTLSSILGGIPLTLFGLFLAYQTTTLRFTFDDTNFSLVRSNGESTGENVVVGGENVWAYNKFVNYDVL